MAWIERKWKEFDKKRRRKKKKELVSSSAPRFLQDLVIYSVSHPSLREDVA